MGKKLDALLCRAFKSAKFTSVVNLALSRLTVLKKQHHARCKQARSDVLELLQLGHHERALLRAEHVIKEQNMLDVYDKIKGYCDLLVERVHLIEHERECPEELKEAASGLIYAASRCGDFPELQEIRHMLTSRFGKEFAARAVELRNNCGVNPLVIQKLSTRMPSVETRMKELKEIASENGIVMQLEKDSSVLVEEQVDVKMQKRPEPEIKEEKNSHIFPTEGKDGEPSDCFKIKQKYKDVADAAQAAFESAAYAAAAARAALELSRVEPHDPDDQHSPSPRPRKQLHIHESVKVEPQQEDRKILGKIQREQFIKNAGELEKSKYISTSNSAEGIFNGTTASVDAESAADPFDESDNETDNKHKSSQSSKQASLRHHTKLEGGSGHVHSILNTVAGSQMQSPHAESEKRPFSVRTRRVRGY